MNSVENPNSKGTPKNEGGVSDPQFHERGTGRTTRAIKEAPVEAVYVTATFQEVEYTKRLARDLGRKDLQIINLDRLENLRGQELTGLILDHHCYDVMTDRRWHEYRIAQAMARVRKPVKTNIDDRGFVTINYWTFFYLKDMNDKGHRYIATDWNSIPKVVRDQAARHTIMIPADVYYHKGFDVYERIRHYNKVMTAWKRPS